MTYLLPAFVGKPEINRVFNCDALTLLRAMPSESVDLIAVDWPYNGVKDEAWDNQWATDADFLKWMGDHLAEMKRVLKPNGSYYGFASPRMAARVEVLTGEYFNVLNHLVWYKTNGNRNWSADKDVVRSFLPNTERIIFAEPYGSDEHASGESGFFEAEAALKARIFGEPIRLAMTETSTSTHELTEVTGAYGNVNHGGAASNWLNGFNIPTPSQYEKIRDYLNSKGGKNYFPQSNEVLREQYEQMRREFEILRTEYESLRRPFAVSADVPYTDVWDFATVGTYAGKHPCEKPLAMMKHIVSASSRKGDLVLDCFCGTGNTLLAAKQLERNYIGCDIEWAAVARNRLVTEFGGRKVFKVTQLDDLPMFAGLGQGSLEASLS